MENASKALIMAGGVLLTIMIVSLLMFSWRSYTNYRAEQDRLEMIEDTKKFNEQFANYDRDDVSGYELLSLVNKVIDYNQRLSKEGMASDDTKNAGNTEQNNPITVTIDLNKSRPQTKSDFTTTITIPAVIVGQGNPTTETKYEMDFQLFTEDDYQVSGTKSYFDRRKRRHE